MGGAPTARRRRWIRVSAAIVLVVGVASAAFSGVRWRDQVERRRDDAVGRRIDAVAATVTSFLQRENDVTDGALALVRTVPEAGSADLQAWFDRTVASGQFPDIQAFSLVEWVAKADVPQTLARMARALPPGVRSGDLAVGAPWDFSLDPAASHYCLPTATAAAAGRVFTDLPAEYRKLDACRTPSARVILLARDTGTMTAARGLRPGMLAVGAPYYRTGTVPSTVAARRAEFAGVMGAYVDGDALLKRAVGDQAMWLQLARVQQSGAVEVVATTGDDIGADVVRTVSLNAYGRWVLRVAAVEPAGGALPGTQGLAVFGFGTVVTLLVFGLLSLAARSREHALRLVDERTAELRHLALHDTLTDLPNRALVMDRADLMLRRAQRNRLPCAAMFIDLDRFKDINDTLGHQAGDRLLETVAERLTRVLRDGDTVGRMGGDEFVVLLAPDGEAPEPTVVAARILEVLREPIELTATETAYTVSASIGIALGIDETVTDLLRNADIALYEAKAGGRDRYVVFNEQMRVALEKRMAIGSGV